MGEKIPVVFVWLSARLACNKEIKMESELIIAETERLGFQREAHLRKNVYWGKDENGKAFWKDTYIYARLGTVEK